MTHTTAANRLPLPVFMQRILGEVNQSILAADAKRAEADPLANKHTTVMPNGAGYRYMSVPKNGKGQTVRYCYSVHRNAAGFFLGWRETIQKNGTGKRDMWLSRRVKRRVVEVCQRRANVVLAKQRKVSA